MNRPARVRAEAPRRCLEPAPDIRPPVPGPGDRRDRHQPLLAVLPRLDAQDAPRAVRLQPEPGPVFLDRLLHRRRRRLPHDRLPGQVAGGRGFSVHGARMATFLACSLLTAPQHGGRLLAGLVAAPGHAACDRVRLAGPVPHLLRLHARSCRRGGWEMSRACLSFLTWTATRSSRSRSAAGSTGPTPIPRSCSWPG